MKYLFLLGVLLALVAGAFFSFERYKSRLLSRFGDVAVVEHRQVSDGPGASHDVITVERRFLPVPFKLYVFRFDPRRFKIGVARLGTPHGWIDPHQGNVLTINAGYFTEDGKPTLMLAADGKVFQTKRRILSGFFWCRRRRCDIAHLRGFREARDYEVVVQSTPRLIAHGADTRGVREVRAVDTRAGVGIADDGSVLFFATDNLPWAGLSYRDLRTIFRERLAAKHLMSLDGGSSVQFHFRAGQTTLSVHGGRPVPFAITVNRRE